MSEHPTPASCAWIHYARPRPHWYLLSNDARSALEAGWGDVAERSKAAGGACTGTYHIRGQHDFETVSVWTFPGSQAAYDHWQALVAARYPEFFAFSNGIGLEVEGAGDG